jgi:hypothetical protein
MIQATSTIVQVIPSSDGLYIFLSGIFGAAIGATAAYVTTRLQLKNAKDLDLDRRLFDARRQAYETAVSIFSFTHNERLNGRPYPSHSTDSDAMWKTHNMMGPVMLWSQKEVAQKVNEFAAYLASPIPTDPAEKSKDMMKGNGLWYTLIMAMRGEVGMEDFLKTSVAELPKEPI